MRIYTKTGDKGETSLANMARVSKSSTRLEAYGTADELNAWVGMLRAQCASIASYRSFDGELSGQLQWVQNRLFNIGAALSMSEGEWIREADVLQLEQWIDHLQGVLPPMHCFIQPTGSEAIATAHLCRTTTRRLERCVVRLHGEEDRTSEQEKLLVRYINRLSDYFFVLARYIAHTTDVPEEPWKKD